MTQVVTTRKARKKQSRFEKLWARAVKLRKSNEKLDSELAALIDRMHETILPKEIEIAKEQTPLFQKLLQLGQRKSLTHRERYTLDEWIRSMLEDFHQLNLVDDELRDHVAHYDAYRMGIKLEDESTPPYQQFMEKIQQAEQEERLEQEREQQAMHEHIDSIREKKISKATIEVERVLDRTLGARPLVTESATADLWEDELTSLQDESLRQYDKHREALRKELMEDKLDKIEKELKFMSEDPWDEDMDFPDLDEILESVFGDHDFNSDFTGGKSTHEKPAHENLANGRNDTALSNDTFQQLFRAAAAKLHPDREPDAEVRLEKQKLMATLLKARKNGDLLTVLDLYETWVGEHEGFSKKDQKSLEETLQAWLNKLEEERDELISSSPLHSRAYHCFYRSSRKSTDKAFAEYLSDLQDTSDLIEDISADITSVKKLKPWLASRYDQMLENGIFF